MNPTIEFLKKTEGAILVNEDGRSDRFRLRSPMTEEEIRVFEAGLPSPLPEEMHELLRFAKGIEGVLIDGVDFANGVGFGLEEIFPHARSLAADGFGNCWIVDLTRETKSFGPIFYACHDAPVIVYQSDSLLHFIREAVRFGNRPWKSEIDDVHEVFANKIWRENPGVLSFAHCLARGDYELRTFAQSLDESWEFVDLRNPKLGDGYSWGRYGPKTVNRRYGDKRIFACQKKSLSRRFLDSVR